MPEPNKEVLEVVRNLIRGNPDVGATAKSLIDRGTSMEYAEAEIARALLACLWEEEHGMSPRLPAVLRGLREGRSTVELFPDDLYKPRHQP